MKLFLGCAGVAWLFLSPLRAGDDSRQYLINGYSLLHHLSEQEKPVDLILIVKTAPRAVADFAHEAAHTAGENLDLLDGLAARDHAIRFNEMGLPQFELDTREAIKDDKQHLLLFGTTNKDFSRAFLVTQIEAGTYGMNLAQVLSDAETNPHRAAVARKISKNWEALRDKAYGLLNSL
jgi:hypothetical protein